MVLSIPVLLLLVPFIIFLVMAIIRGEPSGSDFWWKLLIAAAVLLTFGLIHS